ncbi:hypothetical protein EVAR_20873_1 [Eumeta japonica]|uniref:Uncharacterized protein n=1 Tax=Eumeta variegata TaxID=151549 RepID=A0A4C1UV91_EUMVA|nr:hypothetical protein EVAR_20873_1 [Eumeta japonica]
MPVRVAPYLSLDNSTIFISALMKFHRQEAISIVDHRAAMQYFDIAYLLQKSYPSPMIASTDTRRGLRGYGHEHRYLFYRQHLLILLLSLSLSLACRRAVTSRPRRGPPPVKCPSSKSVNRGCIERVFKTGQTRSQTKTEFSTSCVVTVSRMCSLSPVGFDTVLRPSMVPLSRPKLYEPPTANHENQFGSPAAADAVAASSAARRPKPCISFRSSFPAESPPGADNARN